MANNNNNYQEGETVVVKLNEWKGKANHKKMAPVSHRLFKIEYIKSHSGPTLFGQPLYVGYFMPWGRRENPARGMLEHDQISHKETRAYQSPEKAQTLDK